MSVSGSQAGVVLEICAATMTGVQAALDGGADRIELCSGLETGGLTPSSGAIRSAVELLKGSACKLHILIRPRSGDFLYSALEIQVMEHDIRQAAASHADGVVFGALAADGRIDVAAMQRLQLAAGGLSCTCHRAFDMVADQRQALATLMQLGMHRVLTSGSCSGAQQGAARLKDLVQQAGDRIIILAAGGIRPGTVRQLLQQTGAWEVHSSAREIIHSKMLCRPDGAELSPTDWQWSEVSELQVQALAEEIKHKS